MIREPAWRLVATTVPGSAHRARGECGQDAFGVSEVCAAGAAPVLVAAVADGAGSARHSADGAAAAIDAFRDCVYAYLARAALEDAGVDEVTAWLLAAQQGVHRLADERDTARRDFACTFLGAVVGPSHALLVQIGDGMIACTTAQDSVWSAPIKPQRGEYRNETFFLSDADAPERAVVYQLSGTVTRITLTTDGLEDLCIEQSTGAVYAPFFEAMFSTIEKAESGVSQDDLVRALARYLDSDAVNAITGDDKTLVLASRN